MLDIPYGVDWELVDKKVELDALKEKAHLYVDKLTTKHEFLIMMAEEDGRRELAKPIEFLGKIEYRSPKLIEEMLPNHVKHVFSTKKRWYDEKWRAERDAKIKAWEALYHACKDLRREQYKNKPKPRQAPTNWHLAWALRTLSNHRHRGFNVDIDPQLLAENARNAHTCPICKCSLAWVSINNKPHGTSPTLDRINNEKHLTPANSRIICHKCNQSKGARSEAELITWARQVLEAYAQ